MEHNVLLQREISTFNEKETRNRSIMTYSAEQLKSLSMKVENMSNENEDIFLSCERIIEQQWKIKIALEEVSKRKIKSARNCKSPLPNCCEPAASKRK